MTKKLIILAMLFLIAGLVMSAPSAKMKCQFKTCSDRDIVDGDLLCDWYKDKKFLKVHAKHVLHKHLRTYKK